MTLRKRYIALAALIGLGLLACSTTNELDQTWLEEKYGNETSKFLEVHQNRVHYRIEGQGEPILLLHGTASSLHAWDQWAEVLKSRYKVIRLDLPGFGLTGPDPENRYEVHHDVEFIKAFTRHLELDSYHIAGSSLGGRIAWQYALSYPERVKSLTLIDAVGYPQETWPLPILLGQIPFVDKLVENVQPWFLVKDSLLDIYFDADAVNAELVDRYYELARFPGNLQAFTKRVKARLDQDHEKIQEVSQPTLILWGEEDKYFPVSAAQRFHKDIRNSILRTYPDTGHLPMEEKPQQSVKDFMAFLATHSLSP